MDGYLRLREHTSPKHLRVGVNSAMVQVAALVRLLTTKGLISEEEFAGMLADVAEEEQASYERWLTERLGTDIHLS